MGAAPTSESHVPPSTILEGLALAVELLHLGKYQRLASLFHETQTIAKQEDHPLVTELLEAAHHLSLTCQDYQEEVGWQRHTLAELIRREKKLNHRIQDVLSILKMVVKSDSGTELPQAKIEAETTSHPETEARPTLLRRARDMLGLESSSVSLPADITSVTSDEPELSIEPITDKEDAFQASLTETAVTVESPSLPTLTIYCLGQFRAYVNEVLIDNWSGHKSKSVFKYLVTFRERPILIEVLMDTFWPDSEPESARRNLYQAIYQIRQSFQSNELDTPIILSSNGSYALNPDISIWIDFEEFMQQYQYGRQLYRKGHQQEGAAVFEAVDSLYDGDFLVEEQYEDWTFQKREHNRQAHLEILEKLSSFYYGQKRWAICIAYAQKLLSEDNCNEEAHRLMMQAYYHQGHRHLALRQYYRCVQALHQELETEPMPETFELYQQLRIN